MKLVYVSSPYRARDEKTLKRNIEYAKELTREILLRDECPVTPHLYMTQCLNEDNEKERSLGLNAGIKVLEACDEVVVGYRYGISEGMEREIHFAKIRGICIEYMR